MNRWQFLFISLIGLFTMLSGCLSGNPLFKDMYGYPTIACDHDGNAYILYLSDENNRMDESFEDGDEVLSLTKIDMDGHVGKTITVADVNGIFGSGSIVLTNDRIQIYYAKDTLQKRWFAESGDICYSEYDCSLKPITKETVLIEMGYANSLQALQYRNSIYLAGGFKYDLAIYVINSSDRSEIVTTSIENSDRFVCEPLYLSVTDEAIRLSLRTPEYYNSRYIELNHSFDVIHSESDLRESPLSLYHTLAIHNGSDYIYMGKNGCIDSHNNIHYFYGEYTNGVEYLNHMMVTSLGVKTELEPIYSIKTDYPTSYDFLNCPGRVNTEIDDDDNIHITWTSDDEFHYFKVSSSGDILVSMDLYGQLSSYTLAGPNLFILPFLSIIALLVTSKRKW